MGEGRGGEGRGGEGRGGGREGGRVREWSGCMGGEGREGRGGEGKEGRGGEGRGGLLLGGVHIWLWASTVNILAHLLSHTACSAVHALVHCLI